jgi:hypothetical protein
MAIAGAIDVLVLLGLALGPSDIVTAVAQQRTLPGDDRADTGRWRRGLGVLCRPPGRDEPVPQN